jgi:hypothetical protein
MSVKRILLSAFSVVLCASAAIAADAPDDAEFVYWQDSLVGKESGVYEHRDSVFAVVRIPLASGNRMRMKSMAMQQFSAQLRRWALEQTARERGKEPAYPAAVADMAALNDELLPGWEIPNWQISIGCRQFPPREKDGFYMQCQVYQKAALLKAIPQSFRRYPTVDETMDVFAKNAVTAFRKDKKAFAVKCGFFEFSLSCTKDQVFFPDPEVRTFPKNLELFIADARNTDAGKASKEWKNLNATLAKALRQSSICTSCVAGRPVTNDVVSSVTVSTPVVSGFAVTNSVVTEAGVTNLVISHQSVTNFVESAQQVTNQVVKIIRDESDKMLLSAGLLRRAPGPLTFASALPAADATAEQIRVALRSAATDPRLWKALAARYGADGDPALSLSCLLNALSMTPSDTDIVAEIALRYDELGCPELARGAALFAFGTAKDEATREKVKPLLAR